MYTAGILSRKLLSEKFVILEILIKNTNMSVNPTYFCVL